jgi:hypothetical protein
MEMALFLEFIIICVIQMLYLQSIPSRSREGAQIHAIGANNYYLPIYELSPLPNGPVPAQHQKYRGISRMPLCLVIVYIKLHVPPSYKFPLFPPSPPPSPGCLGIWDTYPPLNKPSYSLPRHFRHPISWFVRSFLKRKVGSCLARCIIVVGSCLDLIHEVSIYRWGYAFYFLGSLVSWSAVKQKSIVLSSTEAEYYAMTHAFKEALWMHVFLGLLKFPVPQPFPILSDNQAACALSQSPAISARSKHIDICHHFIHSLVQDGSFSTTWIPTEDMPADIFTKSLPSIVFSRHHDALGLFIPPSLI